MPTNTSGGTTTSLDNTPQAKDDFFSVQEDAIVYFDVMANDLGGNAKILWSIDNTSDDGSGDLVSKDVAAVAEYSELGAKISLTSDGKIRYDSSALDQLAAGETATDQFTYAIRLANGTLSWATVTVTLTGVNDAPEAADDTGAGNEDSLISGSVATNDSDVDNGAVLSYAINGAAPAGFAMDGDGNWTLDASDAAYQHLAAGATTDVFVSYTVTDEHGASDTATLTITVTGVNDAPEAADDAGAGNEDALITGSVAANDDDVDDGATLSYAINGAAPAGFAMDGDGNWTLDASDSSYQHLAAGATMDVVISYTVTDEHGASDTAALTITVTGVNDAPEAADDTGAGNEDSLISGSVAANDDDVDDGAALSYAINGGAPAGFSMDGDGNWTLDASDAAYQHLAAGATTDVVVSYTVTDEHGATDTATLTITVNGVNDAPEAADDLGDGNEDALITGSVAANDDDVDDGAVLSYAVNGTAPAGFSMDGDGNWSLDASDPAYQHLAAGTTTDVVVSCTVTDEHGASDTATLTITVTGVNDAPEAADDVGDGSEDGLILGSVATNDDDVDDGATLSYAINGAAPAGFSMDGDGNWALDASDAAYQHLATGATMDVVVGYTVSDEHGASDTATLTITVTGVNDAPEAEDDVGAGNEDSLISGSVAANDDDVDDGATLGYTINGSAPAGFSMDGDGNWSLDASDPAYQHLAAGATTDVIVSYTVTDEHGESDTATLTITVTGVNDAALIAEAAGADHATIEAGGVANGVPGDATASGQLNVTDVDDGEDHFEASGPADLAGTYGNFTFDEATGQWSYALDNTLAATQALNVGDAVSDTLTVFSHDGTSYDIVVNIAGTNDAAVIGGTTTGTVVEATPSDPGDPDATGTLTASDVDDPDDLFVAQGSTATASGYGSYTMSAAGVWAYTLNNANPTVNALATGAFLMDSFTVQSADGTTQTIEVTITGATDAIVVTPPPTENGADPSDFDTAGPAAGATVTSSTSMGTETWNGTNGVDTIDAGNGTDDVYGHDGNDVINGENGSDVSLYGQAGNDTITGGNGNDQIFGGSGDDTIVGGADNDTIYGGSGADMIDGSAGNDIIIGGYGADTLTGGGGDDTFRFLSTLDTNDFILDFMDDGNDQIDLSAIDANGALGGDQAFGWGGTTATANSLWFAESGGNTVLYGDTDGNAATAEFMITLSGFTGFNAFSNPLNPPPDITF